MRPSRAGVIAPTRSECRPTRLTTTRATSGAPAVSADSRRPVRRQPVLLLQHDDTNGRPQADEGVGDGEADDPTPDDRDVDDGHQGGAATSA